MACYTTKDSISPQKLLREMKREIPLHNKCKYCEKAQATAKMYVMGLQMKFKVRMWSEARAKTGRKSEPVGSGCDSELSFAIQLFFEQIGIGNLLTREINFSNTLGELKKNSGWQLFVK